MLSGLAEEIKRQDLNFLKIKRQDRKFNPSPHTPKNQLVVFGFLFRCFGFSEVVEYSSFLDLDLPINLVLALQCFSVPVYNVVFGPAAAYRMV